MGTIPLIDAKGGAHVPVSKADQRAVAKYVKANYDEVKVRVPKGRKDTIKCCANAAGQSVNAYIIQSVDERIAREKGASEYESN